MTHKNLRSSIELSVVLPCLNEERTVGHCVKDAISTMKKKGIQGEVIVADNGSTDESIRIAQDAGARVIRVPKRGYGSALSGGIVSATSKYIVMADADDSYEFEHLPRFLEKLKQGYDLVVGNRFAGGIKPGAMPLSHRFGNPILSGLGRLFFSTPIHDFHCGIRGLSKTAFARMKLQTHGMEFASEMIVKATLLNMHITEVATTLRKDGRNRPPHLQTWKDGWRHLRFMLLFCPRWLLLYPGVILIIVGLGTISLSLLNANPHPLLSLLGLTCAIIGMETVTFWDVGQTFAFGAGLHPHDPSQRALRLISRIETSLLISGVLIVIGASGLILTWGSRSPHALIMIITSLTSIILGVQFALGGLLIGLIRINRRASSI